MSLAAFVIFVVPWVALAVLFTRAPSVLRLGATPEPWRDLPTHRELARAYRHETQPHDTRPRAQQHFHPGSAWPG